MTMYNDDDAQQRDYYPISSPGPFGSGELKSRTALNGINPTPLSFCHPESSRVKTTTTTKMAITDRLSLPGNCSGRFHNVMHLS